MSVLVETTVGLFTIDVDYKTRQLPSFKFIQLSKADYFFFSPFHSLKKDVFVQCGFSDAKDSTNVFSSIPLEFKENDLASTISSGIEQWKTPDPMLPSSLPLGTVAFTTTKNGPTYTYGSNFMVILTNNDPQLDKYGPVVPFGKVTEGFVLMEAINDSLLDNDGSFQIDIRITHTHLLHDPFARYPVKKYTRCPTSKQLEGMRLLGDDQEKLNKLINNKIKTKTKTTIETNISSTSGSGSDAVINSLTLEILGDIPTHNFKPSPETLFVARLNPITDEDALAIVFGRFGKIVTSKVVRDPKTKTSLGYGFIEFSTKKEAEDAYFRLQKGCVIDDRQVIVDFSQSSYKK